MRYLNRLACAVAALAVTAATGSAQQLGQQPTSSTVTPGGSLSTTAGNQMGGGQTGPSENAFQLQTLEAPPQITAPTGTGGGLDASNRLGGWYANPLSL